MGTARTILRPSYPALDMSEAEKTLERAPLATGNAGSTLEIRAEDIVVEESVVRPMPAAPAAPAPAGATQEIRAVDILEEKVELNLPPPPPLSAPLLAAPLLLPPPPPSLPPPPSFAPPAAPSSSAASWPFASPPSTPSLPSSPSMSAAIPAPPLSFPPAPPPPPAPPSFPRVEQHSYPSVTPIALDLPIPPPPRPIRPFYLVAEATLQLPRIVARRNLVWVVATAVGLSVMILMAAVARRAYVAYAERNDAASGAQTSGTTHVSASSPRTPVATRAVPPPPAPPAAAAAPPAAATRPSSNASAASPTSTASPHPNASVPTVDLESLPRTGTIRATGHGKLLVDGEVAARRSVVLPCGDHVVQLGAGAAHSIDVPCGGVAYVH